MLCFDLPVDFFGFLVSFASAEDDDAAGVVSASSSAICLRFLVDTTNISSTGWLLIVGLPDVDGADNGKGNEIAAP